MERRDFVSPWHKEHHLQLRPALRQSSYTMRAVLAFHLADDFWEPVNHLQADVLEVAKVRLLFERFFANLSAQKEQFNVAALRRRNAVMTCGLFRAVGSQALVAIYCHWTI